MWLVFCQLKACDLVELFELFEISVVAVLTVCDNVVFLTFSFRLLALSKTSKLAIATSNKHGHLCLLTIVFVLHKAYSKASWQSKWM